MDILDAGTGSAAGGSDYTPFPTRTIVFPEGSTDGDSQMVQLEVLEDTDIEGDETVILQLTNFYRTDFDIRKKRT